MASGGQHGLAQSLFQVGGNAGSAFGPLLAALMVLPAGQRASLGSPRRADRDHAIDAHRGLVQESRRDARQGAAALMTGIRNCRGAGGLALAVLMALVFSKYFYLASLTSYYTFFLISRFHLPMRSAQIHLFVFLGAVAAGTFIGGPVGDRIGRKYVIWCSILGVLPFTLVLPYANLFWTPC